MKAKKTSTTAAPAAGATIPGGEGAGLSDSATGGAIASAGVLTAADEDDDEGEEADLPQEFDYQTDNEEDE